MGFFLGGIPAVAAHELFYGAYKSGRRAQNLAPPDGLRSAVLEFERRTCGKPAR